VSDFGELQRVDAGVLNVGYAEAGPADGPAVLLLHGWPYATSTASSRSRRCWRRRAIG
jgi:pimeloyl-ACP methyl ester carboxylesterase